MIVETYDSYFEGVCELDIMFNVEKAHMILDEVVSNGEIVETNRSRILAPVRIIDKVRNFFPVFPQRSRQSNYKNIFSFLWAYTDSRNFN